MWRTRGVGLVAALGSALLLSAGGLLAQQDRPPTSGGLTASLGQPRLWHRHVGAGAGWIFGRASPSLVAEGRFGVYSDLLNPVIGLLGVQFEAYGGARGADADYGFRGQLLSPYLHLGVGLDLNGPDRRGNLLLSLTHPIRRGGILGGGSELTVDYLPGRHGSFSVGLQVPVGRRIHMGQTRPRAAAVHLDEPPTPLDHLQPDPAMAAVMADLTESARWIARMTAPFMERSAFYEKDALEATGRGLQEIEAHLEARDTGAVCWGPEDEVRRFHSDLDRAFSLASGADDTTTALGRHLADRARQVMLDEILIPYDRLLGQVKDPDTAIGFGMRARGVFVRWLYTDPAVRRERVQAALWVFARVIDIVEANRRAIHNEWRDSRYVWLPLQYALRPEDHDSQQELDALVERVADVRFTDGNRVWYVVNEQFPLQLSRTILAAREYHVLWIHDVRGLDDSGDPDGMTYRIVLAYLSAMTQRVKAYDSTAEFPVYMIFLDQWYYELNHSRFWMNLLQDPLHDRLHLPGAFRAWSDTIAAVQQSLRDAVAGSRLLQDQAAQFGASWLRDLIRVHVSITNPADPSFWRDDLIPIWGLPDNFMRDHRKIAFYDVSEDDPYRGGAIYTGAGVGEHYTTLNWEDRAIVAEGPALLSLKYAARDLLLNQGIPPERIPWALRPRPFAPAYWQRVQEHVDTGHINVRGLEVHNETGYNPKRLDLVKAVLYTMMPRGSVAIVPDALWSSGFWAGLLVGHALRGGRSLLISPAPANAPSTMYGGMSLSYDMMARVLLARRILGPSIEKQGGLLEVGIYHPRFEVTDLHAKLATFKQGVDHYAWFRQLYDLSPTVYDEIARLAEQLQHQNEQWQRSLHFEGSAVPKLHLKANFLASKEAWDGLLHLPAWPDALRAFMLQRAWQIENRDRALGHLESSAPNMIDVGQPMLDGWLKGLPPGQRNRIVLYMLVGSSNQDYRSLSLDGEAGFLAAGTTLSAGLIDLVALTGQCDWVDSLADLTAVLPRPGAWKLQFARWFRLLY